MHFFLYFYATCMLFPENLVFVAGLKVAPGLKRKLPSFQDEEMDCSDALFPDSTRPNHILNSKTSRLLDYRHWTCRITQPATAWISISWTIQWGPPNLHVQLKDACRGALQWYSQLVHVYNLIGIGESRTQRELPPESKHRKVVPSHSTLCRIFIDLMIHVTSVFCSNYLEVTKIFVRLFDFMIFSEKKEDFLLQFL